MGKQTDQTKKLKKIMDLSLTFSDEFEGELDVEGVGAIQIPGHDHSHTILQSKVTATVSPAASAWFIAAVWCSGGLPL